MRAHSLMQHHADFTTNKIKDQASAKKHLPHFLQEVLKAEKEKRGNDFDYNHPSLLPLQDLVAKMGQGALNTRAKSQQVELFQSSG